LEKDGVEVWGTFRWRSPMDNVKHLKGRIEFVECDLRDSSSVLGAVERVKPDWIFHLAAQSFVPTSWLSPSETLVTNIVGEVNLFEAVKKVGIKPRIQIAGSSEEYGLVTEEDLPIRETTLLSPLSPYGVSKVGQDLLGFQYFQSYGLPIIRTRAFNHTGPRRPADFVCSDFAKQIVEIREGKKEPLMEVGNLDVVRDFTDVRDVVVGYWLALDKGKPGEVYNIASGRGRKIRKVLDLLRDLSGIDFKMKVQPTRLRPSDVPRLVGDAGKFHKLTGWQPEIPFRKTLQDLLEFWGEKI